MKKFSRRAIAAATLIALAGAAQGQMIYFLVGQWYENGNQMCKYGNGTVLNVGINLCPLQIKG